MKSEQIREITEKATERWFLRKARQRLAGSESLGACFIQREIVRSEMSKPSMSSSPWMRGAPQVVFSATIRKINCRCPSPKSKTRFNE